MKIAASQSLSGMFGVLMVTVPTAGSSSRGAAIIALFGLVVILAGLRLRLAATPAVLLAGCVIVLAESPPSLAGLAGLCAAGYLVLRHAGTMTAPTVVTTCGFTIAGLAATAFPLSLPWLPLLAPVAVLGIYLLAVQPFLGR